MFLDWGCASVLGMSHTLDVCDSLKLDAMSAGAMDRLKLSKHREVEARDHLNQSSITSLRHASWVLAPETTSPSESSTALPYNINSVTASLPWVTNGHKHGHARVRVLHAM